MLFEESQGFCTKWRFEAIQAENGTLLREAYLRRQAEFSSSRIVTAAMRERMLG